LEEAGAGAVRIGSFFSCGKELFREGDLFFTCEDDAEKALAEESLKTIYADPLFEGLLPTGPAKPEFVPVPHRAVSGRLFDGNLQLKIV
jgi:hypothetical protein